MEGNTGVKRKFADVAVKRELVDVAKDYAKEIQEEETILPACVHVVNVLTLQHGGAFPVSLNMRTRSTVCGVLKDQLGEKAYAELCVKSASTFKVDRLKKELKAAGKKTDGLKKEALVALLQTVGPWKQDVSPVPDLCKRRRGGEEEEEEEEEEALLRQIQRKMSQQDNASALLEDGAQLFKDAVLTPQQVQRATAALAPLGTSGAAGTKTLSAAQGNGKNGCYCDVADSAQELPPILRAVARAAKEWIEKHAGELKKPLGSKTILLRYGKGGVNYAHHDNSGDFQALLMLSQPGEDYTGGEFYVANSEPPFAQRRVPFTCAGQLIIFRGNQGNGTVPILHAMTEVGAGAGGTACRFAVGFFQ
jgi:hypothetical protein